MSQSPINRVNVSYSLLKLSLIPFFSVAIPYKSGQCFLPEQVPLYAYNSYMRRNPL